MSTDNKYQRPYNSTSETRRDRTPRQGTASEETSNEHNTNIPVPPSRRVEENSRSSQSTQGKESTTPSEINNQNIITRLVPPETPQLMASAETPEDRAIRAVKDFRKEIEEVEEGKYDHWLKNLITSAKLNKIHWLLTSNGITPTGIDQEMLDTLNESIVSTIQEKIHDSLQLKLGTEVWLEKPSEVIQKIRNTILVTSEILTQNLKDQAAQTKIGNKTVT